jgi:hypothetical protein
MSEQQILSVALKALEYIVTGGLGGAAAALIGNWFVNQKLQKQEHKHQKELETLKASFEKKTTVHRLQFEKEFQLYGELWKALVSVRKTVVIAPSIDRMPNDKTPIEEYSARVEQAIKTFNFAKDLFEDHRPFYHDDVSLITSDLLDQCRMHIVKVRNLLKLKDFGGKLHDEADEMFENVVNDIKRIEQAIKNRIGLLQTAEIVD